MTEPLLLRPSTVDDIAAMTHIYADAVRSGTGSFELVAPDAAQMAQRRAAVLDAGWPWLVAQRGEVVLGFAYAQSFRPRPAYRWCVEDSIYLDRQARAAGIGRLLLAELIGRCAARGARQMLALIGDAANAGSIGLHRVCGFEHRGTLPAVGWKFERWLDVVLMQRTLGEGSLTPPPDHVQ